MKEVEFTAYREDEFIPDGQFVVALMDDDLQYHIIERLAGVWMMDKFDDPGRLALIAFAKLP